MTDQFGLPMLDFLADPTEASGETLKAIAKTVEKYMDAKTRSEVDLAGILDRFVPYYLEHFPEALPIRNLSRTTAQEVRAALAFYRHRPGIIRAKFDDRAAVLADIPPAPRRPGPVHGLSPRIRLVRPRLLTLIPAIGPLSLDPRFRGVLTGGEAPGAGWSDVRAFLRRLWASASLSEAVGHVWVFFQAVLGASERRKLFFEGLLAAGLQAAQSDDPLAQAVVLTGYGALAPEAKAAALAYLLGLLRGRADNKRFIVGPLKIVTADPIGGVALLEQLKKDAPALADFGEDMKVVAYEDVQGENGAVSAKKVHEGFGREGSRPKLRLFTADKRNVVKDGDESVEIVDFISISQEIAKYVRHLLYVAIQA